MYHNVIFFKVSTNESIYWRFQKHQSMLQNQGKVYLEYASFQYIDLEYTNEN